jgi:hypothetical protein
VIETIKACLAFGQLSSMHSVKDRIEPIAIQPAAGDIAFLQEFASTPY